ncbi:hypothetical protein NDU88_002862 [Pleurodeles waltl]|uniref:Uncharacterized protein n=1 Tax=Pleurodeles waltl TaxID=8319 RepID=A0AAV7TNV1_PLEWA|nr:hypothetical protein NDU88_002862 [Pleurodeles waltl]
MRLLSAPWPGNTAARTHRCLHEVQTAAATVGPGPSHPPPSPSSGQRPGLAASTCHTQPTWRRRCPNRPSLGARPTDTRGALSVRQALSAPSATRDHPAGEGRARRTDISCLGGRVPKVASVYSVILATPPRTHFK